MFSFVVVVSLLGTCWSLDDPVPDDWQGFLSRFNTSENLTDEIWGMLNGEVYTLRYKMYRVSNSTYLQNSGVCAGMDAIPAFIPDESHYEQAMSLFQESEAEAAWIGLIRTHTTTNKNHRGYKPIADGAVVSRMQGASENASADALPFASLP